MVNLTVSTKSVKNKDIKRDWRLFDAKGRVLGRFVTEIVRYLIGKHKVNYISHLDAGDFVVVVNAKHIVLTGKKEKTKIYSKYSGYPGGLKKVPFSFLKEKNPKEIIKHAVSGMLPKNKLRDRRLARLFVFADEKHPYKDKFEALNSKSQINLKSK
jgi:large subunit ribosomal protein L13